MPKLPKTLPLPLAPTWKDYKAKWTGGCGSTECERACNVVLARGTVPCHVLFVGEAPGDSEDAIGQPFVGPAGKLLDYIVRESLGEINRHRAANKLKPRTHAMTNVVGCMPLDDSQDKLPQPRAEQIARCKPRLQEFVALCNPRMIVCVGKLAWESFERGFQHSVKYPKSTAVCRIDHPAFVLRQHLTQQGLLVQKAVIEITETIERMESGEAS